MKVQYKRLPLVSLAISSRKHFCHSGGHKIQVSVCLWLWQPRLSINHSVTSTVNLAKIWTIVIMFESPWLRSARFDSKFSLYVVPRGALLCQLVFYGSIASWEPRHTRKTIWLFLTYCFINLLVNYLLHAAPYVIYWWRNVVEKI